MRPPAVSYSDRLADVVADGFDLAIRFSAASQSEELISRLVTRVRGSACASPDYLARHGEPRTLEELRHHACLQFFSRDRRQPWYVRDGEGELVAIEPASRLRFDSAEALCAAAVAGLGIAQLPEFLTDHLLADGRLKRVLEANEPEPLPIFAVYPTRKHLASRVRSFIDSLIGAEPANSPARSSRVAASYPRSARS